MFQARLSTFQSCIDCCHAGASIRGGSDTRTAEIMCACDDLSSTDSRKEAISFTQQVSWAIRRMFRENPGHDVVLSEVVAKILGQNIADGLKRRPVPQMVHDIVLSLCCDVHECRNSITEMEKQTFGPICRVLHSEACRTTTISPIFPRKYQHPPSKKTFLTPPSPLRQHFHRSS
jgi:hypothetical protein